jgi:chromosome partitioning protein
MISNADVVTFFQQNPALSASVIEQEAGIPTTTLTKALTGDRVLNAKHLASLYPVVKKYGFVDSSSRKAKVISIANHKGGLVKRLPP